MTQMHLYAVIPSANESWLDLFAKSLDYLHNYNQRNTKGHSALKLVVVTLPFSFSFLL